MRLSKCKNQICDLPLNSPICAEHCAAKSTNATAVHSANRIVAPLVCSPSTDCSRYASDIRGVLYRYKTLLISCL